MSVEQPLPTPEIENLLAESRTFPPDPAFAAQANAKADLYVEAEADFEAFWAKRARERIDWTTPFTKTLEWDLPFAKWFTGGQLNVAYNCVDRHVERGLGDKVAYHWIGEPGDTRTLTFRDLQREVSKAANALKELGVETGDRVAIYMPMIPELPIAMLACARIGAPHTVVFGGFSAEALSGRINDCGAKVLITADGGYRRGKEVGLKHHADEALASTPTIEAMIVVRRARPRRPHGPRARPLVARPRRPPVRGLPAGRRRLASTCCTCSTPRGRRPSPRGSCTRPPATSLGTSFSHEAIFDIKPDDVYWCAADIGWVTGHSYIVYGPLANATTGIMYEGAPDTPAWDRWWQIVEDYKVTILYCAPTAIRAFMKQGEAWPAKHDLSTLRVLGSVGEPINPEAWIWYREHIGGDRAPVVDTWWQTETGQILITPLPGVTTTKPGSATFPFPGIDADVVDADGNSVPARWRRLPRPQAAVAGDAARHLRRSGPLSRDVLEPLPGDVLRGRRRQARRGRLPLAARPGRRRHERGRPPHLDDRGRIRPRRPQVGGRGGRRRQEGRRHRPGDLRLRHPQGRPASRPTRSASSFASTSPTSSARSPGRSS